MSEETLVPTMNLRGVQRKHGVALQQMFLTADGKRVWQSIPIVEEDDAKEGHSNG